MVENLVKVTVVKDYIDYSLIVISFTTGICTIIAIWISIKSFTLTNSRNLKEMYEKEITNYPSFLNSTTNIFKIKNDAIIGHERKSFKDIIELQMDSAINGSYFGTNWNSITNSIDLSLFERVDRSKMTDSDKYDIFQILGRHYGVYLTKVGTYKEKALMYYIQWKVTPCDNGEFECEYKIDKTIEYENSEFNQRITLLENKIEFYKGKLFKT